MVDFHLWSLTSLVFTFEFFLNNKKKDLKFGKPAILAIRISSLQYSQTSELPLNKNHLSTALIPPNWNYYEIYVLFWLLKQPLYKTFWRPHE